MTGDNNTFLSLKEDNKGNVAFGNDATSKCWVKALPIW